MRQRRERTWLSKSICLFLILKWFRAAAQSPSASFILCDRKKLDSSLIQAQISISIFNRNTTSLSVWQCWGFRKKFERSLPVRFAFFSDFMAIFAVMQTESGTQVPSQTFGLLSLASCGLFHLHHFLFFLELSLNLSGSVQCNASFVQS